MFADPLPAPATPRKKMRMAEVSENTDDSRHDRCKFTHEWAHRVVFQFHPLAVALRRSWYPQQMQDVRRTFEEHIDNFLTYETQEDRFDFDSFASDKVPSVAPFGEEYAKDDDDYSTALMLRHMAVRLGATAA
jgi:hypothetical protein